MIKKNEKTQYDKPFASQLELRAHLVDAFSKVKTLKFDLKSITILK
jgi:hypothetical protein